MVFNCSAALECLRKKALYEKQLELNDGALMKLQAQRNALDSALMNKNILDTMKTVNSAMKNIHKDMYVFWGIQCFHCLGTSIKFMI